MYANDYASSWYSLIFMLLCIVRCLRSTPTPTYKSAERGEGGTNLFALQGEAHFVYVDRFRTQISGERVCLDPFHLTKTPEGRTPRSSDLQTTFPVLVFFRRSTQTRPCYTSHVSLQKPSLINQSNVRRTIIPKSLIPKYA